MSIRRLARAGLLTAVALTIFMVESQIPAPFPLPGIKLGLANIITVYAMFTLGPKDTFAILLCRILLGSMFSGSMTGLIYSLSGGMLCYAVMLVMSRLLTGKQIWVCSVIGAIAHNIGQVAAAVAVTKTPQLALYLPALMVSGILAGLFTGLCAQLVYNRLKQK